MANLTVSADIDAFLGAADNAAARMALGASAPSDAITPATVQIGGGATVTKVLVGSAACGTGSLDPGQYAYVQITVTGAEAGDYASVATSGASLAGAGGIVQTECLTTSDTVTVVFFNTSDAAQSLSNQTLRAIVFKAS